MFDSSLLALLIPLVALIAFGIGAVLVTRAQRRGMDLDGPAPATLTREDFVRRHHNRPGVVANGATLVDLYDRIGQLESRIAELESTRER